MNEEVIDKEVAKLATSLNIARTIPEELVEIDFQMDPRTKDLVFGDKLTAGQIVLIEDHVFRENPSNMDRNVYTRARSLETARWCRIIELKYNHDIIQFIGQYADGTKQSRTYNQSICWFVKR